MVVRVLLLLAVLATFYGCGQANTPSEHPQKKGIEKSAGQPGKGLTGATPNHGAVSRNERPDRSESNGGVPTVADERRKPNIIFILTDDLDYRPGSISHMPNLQRYLVDQGTTFDNAFVTNALCCPSRATILRGQYSHNHDILTNSAPLGAEQRFSELGLENSTVATWLYLIRELACLHQRDL
jgi:hypothetical protein